MSDKPIAWIIETLGQLTGRSLKVWMTLKPEVAAKYKNRSDAIVTEYFSQGAPDDNQ